MRVCDYIKESEKKEFCNNCNEICSNSCVIYRKASIRYNKVQRKTMTFNQCLATKGIIADCDISGSRMGRYEIQFINSQTNEEDYVTFDVIGAGTKSGNDEAEALFKDFCKTEGIRQNTVTEIHVTKSEDLLLNESAKYPEQNSNEKKIIEADAPKRIKGTPLEENDSGYNCENWIP